ncbi:hypothetical protein Tco_1580616, partial [Tanacetum coccineum]
MPAAASPITDSSGYVPESDPEEELEADDDEDPEEDPVDYPADQVDDEEEEEEPFGDDADDRDEDEDEDEEEEEEHPAPADSVLPVHRMTAMTDRPEITLPPRKRLGIDLGLICEVGESSAAGHKADYGFVDTVDAEISRRRAEEVSYEIRDAWVDLRDVAEE